jgi:hypothetical protein
VPSESAHTVEKKKEIKGHAGGRKGLEAPFPEFAAVYVPLSQPLFTSPYKLILLLGVKRYPSSNPSCVALSVLSAARLSILIASAAPNGHFS